MTKRLFEELCQSIREMGAIRRGELKPCRIRKRRVRRTLAAQGNRDMDDAEALPLVRVTWWDTVSVGAGWCSRAEADTLTPTLCTTIGMLLRETETHLLIARTTNGCGQVGGVQAIPRGCIKDWATARLAFGKTIRRPN